MVVEVVAAGEFKTHCLRILEGVRARREEVVITRKGVPIARLTATSTRAPRAAAW
jgi:antitoxin (DNA-binding transcriptional repressor) of toxin-antitoxin stability system